MEWKTWFPEIMVGGKEVPIRSLVLPDDSQHWRRYRTCTTQGSFSLRFSPKPASGRLAKDPSGNVGVLVTGLYGGWLKIGRHIQAYPYLFVPLNALSKKPRRILLRQIDYELFEQDGIIMAREK